MMKVMVIKKCWFSSTCFLEQREVKIPEMKDNEVMIKVCAVGVNWGDITDVVDGHCPGLECSGIIEAVGRNVNCWKVGERVCAILVGGGYAEKVAVPANFLLPVPGDIDLADAAGLLYASCSIWSALFEICDLNTLKDKKILIREGTSRIGALAIQYAKYMGLTVIASTGSGDMFSMCRDYGADICLDHTSKDFVQEVFLRTGYSGVDFILDFGASDLQRNICCLCKKGKVVIVDLHGMERSRIDIAMLQRMHAEIKVWGRFAVIDAQKALDLLKEDDSIGKIILCMNFEKTSGHLKMEKTSGHFKIN
ncbi:uncharacterized protein [Henckelia pumila]|uniref:uncharacterized protein isoform X2 n=1 Tax=Henckelia pumila TaxID=405737 RepID=UPI003C6DF260